MYTPLTPEFRIFCLLSLTKTLTRWSPVGPYHVSRFYHPPPHTRLVNDPCVSCPLGLFTFCPKNGCSVKSQ